MEKVLAFIHEQLNTILAIPYEFMEWTDDKIPSQYWVGELSDSTPNTEDGKETYTLLLTGTTRAKWLDLINTVDAIKGHFPPVYGLRVDKGNFTIVVNYSNAFPVPTGEADLKRMQVNLEITTWKGIE